MKIMCATCRNVFIDKNEGVFRCGLRMKENRVDSKISLEELRRGCRKWNKKERRL